MEKPSLTDYVSLIFTLFEQFEQKMINESGVKQGKPYTFSQKCFIVLFVTLQYKRIYQFKTQQKWLEQHPEMMDLLAWETVPNRTTFSRRYKALGPILSSFIATIGASVTELDEAFTNHHLVEDKSLFKAQGPVWHQSDRKEGRIPENLRNLDTDATWSKSGYQGWVYGYGIHLTCTEDAFPKLVQVETASINETQVIEAKSETILTHLKPLTLAADNGYAKAMRIRSWAKRGVALLTPASKWVKGRFAIAYHAFIKEPDIKKHLQRRSTSVEPFFDLMLHVLGCDGKRKQLPVQGLANVRTCLMLATFSVQIALVMNSIWSLPLRNISHIRAVFA